MNTLLPEPVKRLLRYAGQTLRTARNPNLTAREAIEVGNWMAACGNVNLTPIGYLDECERPTIFELDRWDKATDLARKVRKAQDCGYRLIYTHE